MRDARDKQEINNGEGKYEPVNNGLEAKLTYGRKKMNESKMILWLLAWVTSWLVVSLSGERTRQGDRVLHGGEENSFILIHVYF